MKQHGAHTVAGRPAVLPIAIAAIRKVDLASRRSRRQLPRAGEKIRVDVGFGHRDHAEPMARGKIEVPIDVALRVHEEGFPALLAGEHVRVLRKRFVFYLANEHGTRLVEIISLPAVTAPPADEPAVS